jgi:hypothetical protein
MIKCYLITYVIYGIFFSANFGPPDLPIFNSHFDTVGYGQAVRSVALTVLTKVLKR